MINLCVNHLMVFVFSIELIPLSLIIRICLYSIIGPDIQGEFSKSIQSQFSSFVIDLKFFGAVLHLRGTSVIKQPLIRDDEQDVLLWNGEIFGGIEVKLIFIVIGHKNHSIQSQS